MKVKFPMSEIAQNAAVMAEIAAIVTYAHNEIARSNVATQPDYENKSFPVGSFIDSNAPSVLCSAVELRNGLINPAIPYTCRVPEWDSRSLELVSYRNAHQSALICRDYLEIEGERCALWGDELAGLMQAIKDSGIEPCFYETTDERLEWHETLASYKEALRNAAPAKISSLHELQDKFSNRASD